MTVGSVYPHHVETDEEPLLAEFFALSERLKNDRVEFIDGNTNVAPPPDGDHETIVDQLRLQMLGSAVALSASGNKGLALPSGDFVVPDATYVPHGGLRHAPSWMPPDDVLLVVEVTSSDPNRDRMKNHRAYALAGIPFHLLIDRQNGKVILYSDPERDAYAGRNEVAFGKKLTLPAPFSVTIDTADLVD
ncbi:Uma2 family endonuclease [Embleya sp. NPDC050154]|uniref:Uma2 family endonuclease n=1 Tax=unclassified Embleya TaxID=2699296 RepID=UPI00378FC888